MGIDFLLKDGIVIDGTGKDRVPERADIAIEGDCIKEVGDLSHIHAEKTISIKGLCVCPGFIDAGWYIITTPGGILLLRRLHRS